MINEIPRPDYFLNMAKARKTTYEFSDREVKDSDIKKILDAARWAPSCSNIQPWRFVVVKNKVQISKLMKTATFGAFHSDPALIIAVILDRDCWENAYYSFIKNAKLGVYEAYLCAAMPALSIVFEAQELGINSAMLTPKQEEASDILKIRENDAIPVMIGLGYEKAGAFQKSRIRKDIKLLTSGEYFGGSIAL